MRSGDVYPSKYLKAEDFAEDLTVTIKKVELEELESNDGKKQTKPVAFFEELDKGLIINKTNWSLIAKQHGDESDEWNGKPITLTVMDVEAFGDIVSAIRIKPVRRVVTPAKVTAKAKTETKSEDDLVTEFWTLAKAQGYDRKEGAKLLNEHGNFAKAIAALKADAESPRQ